MSAKRHEQQIGRKALATVRKFFPGVNRVNDATKPIDIRVTRADCDQSVALDHRNCALAIASKRVTHADGVIIAVRTAYIIKGHTATRFRLLESTSREIVSFDRKGGFAEGEYSLLVPSKWEQLGAPVSGKTHNTSNRRKVKYHFTSGIRTMLNKV